MRLSVVLAYKWTQKLQMHGKEWKQECERKQSKHPTHHSHLHLHNNCTITQSGCSGIDLRQRFLAWAAAAAGVSRRLWKRQLCFRNWIGSDNCSIGFSYGPMHERDRHSHSISWSLPSVVVGPGFVQVSTTQSSYYYTTATATTAVQAVHCGQTYA